MENPKKKINESSLPKDFTDFMEKIMKFAEKKGTEIKEIVEKIKDKTSKQSLETQMRLVAGYDKKKRNILHWKKFSTRK